ncbi:MAG: polysaccharide deacetylase family protein [Bacteroidota bacterium]
MVIFTQSITPRLRYICDFIGTQLTGQPAKLTDKQEEFIHADGPGINYSPAKLTQDEVWISPHPLLFETGVREQATSCFEWNQQKVFFKTEGDFPFDLFAAIFYLLSRYEEYLPHKKDMYGRYAHENSLAYREDFLSQPLVNLWLQEFMKVLAHKFSGIEFHKKNFSFEPTYDIDEAFCYRHKAWWRTLGGYARSVSRGQWQEVKQRRNVLKRKQQDPYDSFDWIKELHSVHHYLDAYIFFLVAEKTGRYDKNIFPFKEPMREIIEKFSGGSPLLKNAGSEQHFYVGVHPSWQSGDNPRLLKKEIDTIFELSENAFFGSRQHFIRFTFPETFRQLSEAGILDDYSMGYGSINGFRASVASDFYWYDLKSEKKSNLRLHPFCYMDANSFFEQKYSPQQALEEMLGYFNTIKSVNGTMITIWHNSFLGTHSRFTGWREVYREFVRKIYYQIPFVNAQIDNEGMDKIHFPH